MLTTLTVWIIRQRLTNALRREEVARNRVAIERQRIAQLEEALEQAELVALTEAHYRDAAWQH